MPSFLTTSGPESCGAATRATLRELGRIVRFEDRGERRRCACAKIQRDEPLSFYLPHSDLLMKRG